MRKELLFKLGPITSGNHCHFDHAEKVVKPFQKTLAALSKEPQLAPTRKLPPKKEPAPEAISMDFAKFDDEETDTLGFSLFDQPKKKS